MSDVERVTLWRWCSPVTNRWSSWQISGNPEPHNTECAEFVPASALEDQIARAADAERERDEARAEREKWRVYALRLMGIRDEYGEPAVLRAERDEARAEAARLRDALIRSAGDGYRARLERDEAQAEATRCALAMHAGDDKRDSLRAEVERLTAERDEARAEVERLRAAIQAHRDTYADPTADPRLWSVLDDLPAGNRVGPASKPSGGGNGESLAPDAPGRQPDWRDLPLVTVSGCRSGVSPERAAVEARTREIVEALKTVARDQLSKGGRNAACVLVDAADFIESRFLSGGDDA